MRKLIFQTAAVALAALSFTACEDMVVSTPETIDLVPKATITGVVTAELNLQSAGEEFVPAGTQLLVEVSYGDINPGATGKWADTIAVATDGKYSVSVPADANGVSVNITPFAFEAEQTQPYGSFVSKVLKTYDVTAATVKTIASGGGLVVDLKYDKLTAAPSFVDKVRITGKFTANLSQETGGYEDVPNGTAINFYSNDWKDSAIVNNGKYSIAVPKGAPLTVSSKFTFSKKVWNSTSSSYTTVNYEFKYETALPKTFNTMDEMFDLVANGAGEGTDLTVHPTVSAVSGLATADLDENFNGFENMPNGTVIKFWTNSSPIWGLTTTVTNGRYAVSAPKDQNVNWSTKFNAVKKVAMVDPKDFTTVYVNEDYEYNMSGSTLFSDDATVYDISASTGTSVNPIYNITGSVKAELDDTNNTTLENIPNGTLIKFYYANSNGSVKNVYVNNGEYAISIPKGRAVKFEGTFNAIQKKNNVPTMKSFTIVGLFTADGSKTVNIIATNN